MLPTALARAPYRRFVARSVTAMSLGPTSGFALALMAAILIDEAASKSSRLVAGRFQLTIATQLGW